MTEELHDKTAQWRNYSGDDQGAVVAVWLKCNSNNGKCTTEELHSGGIAMVIVDVRW
ncbi:hypothetical protein DEO72_LG1g3056 [Vigna unguiculata]|uniref:Uncharacterized protein n=1 Tax=Vigna unguiculata TaxID=3917 RepID=A0A4D6KS90_VIGUN|nr:hypothetical protein DEO72_LG1g3056 [Vigna unguiculata]